MDVRVSRRFVIVALVAGTIAASTSLQLRAQQPATQYVADEVLVQFRSGVSEEARSSVRSAHGATAIRQYEQLRTERLRLPPNANAAAVARAFAAHPEVEAAQPNFIRRAVASAPPNDPYWLDGSLWGLEKIGAATAWNDFGAGADTVVVADIDTGVNYTHPDLAANMWQNPGEVAGNGVDDDGNGYVDDVYGIDAINNDSDPADDHGHGTHTSGTIGAVRNNGLGVVGASINVRILACKFLDAQGNGSDADAIECFNYVVDQKRRGVNVRVTSNSWGGARDGGVPTVLQNAIDAMGNAGILNVFAAGNAGTNNDVTPFDPASLTSPSIVAVAASDGADGRASFSNYGATSVDLAAPGVSILSTYPGGYAWASGTSMAAPHVAGVAAFLLSHRASLTVSDVKDSVLNSVDKIGQWTGVVATGGRLNAYQALAGVSSNASPLVNLTSPASGTPYTAPATVSLAAAASDSDGTVQRVDFYANGGLIGTDTTSPYSLNWNNVAAGPYSLTAVATDNAGAQTSSVAVTIQVDAPPPANAPPQVALTSPIDGATFNVGATVTVTALASDPDDGLARVDFYSGTTKIGTSTGPQYTMSWKPTAVGTFSLTARAYDKAGSTTTSAAVRVRVKRK